MMVSVCKTRGQASSVGAKAEGAAALAGGTAMIVPMDPSVRKRAAQAAMAAFSGRFISFSFKQHIVIR
jgi:hypothetical protein